MRIREAGDDDVGFLTWVMLAASRFHLPIGVWEWVHDQSERQTLDFLRRLTSTDVVHIFHPSLFLIAEVDGTPAAALCGFDPATHGMSAVWQVMPTVLAQSDVTMDEGFLKRAATLGMVASDYQEDAWIVENVATKPEFRRRGLIRALLEEILERGRGEGFNIAQISSLIGNEPARAAYLDAGFERKDEKRDPTFEAEFGSPGFERFQRPLGESQVPQSL